jgi:hypothetical protein
MNFIALTQILGSAETGSKHVHLILFQCLHCAFYFLISTLTQQGRDIMNFKAPRLNKDNIEYLTTNQREMRKTLKKTDTNDDHVKEHFPFSSCHGVSKSGRLTDQPSRGSQDDNTDDGSHSEMLQTAQGVSK